MAILGAMRCEICGTEHDTPAKFCSECGYPLVPDPGPPPVARKRSLKERLGGVKLGAAIGAVLVLLAMTTLAVVGNLGDERGEATASDVGRTTATVPAVTAPPEEDPAEPIAERRRDIDSGTVQKQIEVNETAIDEDVTFKVTRIYPVEKIPLAGTSEEILEEPGEKLVRVDITWKNNMAEPADIFCGAKNAVLLDVSGENYEPLPESLDAERNEDICTADVLPGAKQELLLWYSVPEELAIEGVVLWNSAAADDPDGSKTDVFVETK